MLELRNVAAGYGGRRVLDGVSLTVSPGEVIAVVGVNGSGKSTLLKTAAGMLPLSAGERLLEGRVLSSYTRREAAQQIAYLPQGKNTPDMTVRQMVLHGRFPYLHYPRRYTAQDHAAVRRALEEMDIAELADRPLPTLSGGLRQKAYMALALAQDTTYVLLDEPTAYLDIGAQLDLMKTLRMLANGGKGVAVVLHDLPLAFTHADRVAVLQDGRAVAFDTPQSVMQSGVVNTVFGVGIERDPTTGRYQYAY